MDIANRLRLLREKAGWSQNKLAYEAGVSQSFINQIEAGQKQPSYEVLRNICAALGLTLSEFFADEPSDMPSELRQLLDAAKKLTPEEQQALTTFLKAIKKS